jgi:kinetochore protein NDC80
MPPPPRNPRRTTLGSVSMNSGSGTPSKIPKPSQSTRKSRQSMLPRVSSSGRENSLIPPSPSNSVASSRSMKSRQSVGGGRKSIGGRFGGGSVGRRQSSSHTSTSHSQSVVKQDPRPINDKAYQQHGIRTLLTYLTKRGYEYPVSIKSLTRPSGKDFQHICTFLLQQMDPTFGTSTQHQSGNINNTNTNNKGSQSPHTPKFEEEVALHFKALGYPYSVSKTALVAAGSPHTWPSLLAALVWLVEHIVVIQDAGCQTSMDFDEFVGSKEDNPFESLSELEDKTERAFFAYLHKSYAAFLAGHADQSDAFTERLIDMFEQDNMVIEGEIERVTDLNGGMVETIHMLEEQGQR